ncbi:DUF4326 domain-containing protein [bacterium]|nr:DUF4326 domain-containing protein [bacterium]
MNKVISVKVTNLRKLGYDNIREWLEDETNIYIGRGLRIFINKKPFYIKQSKWRNPFIVKEHGRENCILLYEEWIMKSGLINDIEELRNKTLGCWCKPDKCHGDILVKYDKIH